MSYVRIIRNIAPEFGIRVLECGKLVVVELVVLGVVDYDTVGISVFV